MNAWITGHIFTLIWITFTIKSMLVALIFIWSMYFIHGRKLNVSWYWYVIHSIDGIKSSWSNDNYILSQIVSTLSCCNYMYVAAWKERKSVRKNVWNNNEMFHIWVMQLTWNCFALLYCLQDFCPKKKKKKKKKRRERSFIFQRKGMLCIGYARVNFIHMSTDLYISLILDTKKVECPSNPWLVSEANLWS